LALRLVALTILVCADALALALFVIATLPLAPSGQDPVGDLGIPGCCGILAGATSACSKA